VITIANEINGGGGLMISEKTAFDLEGRCSIQLSYGRRLKNNRQKPASRQICRTSTNTYYARMQILGKLICRFNTHVITSLKIIVAACFLPLVSENARCWMNT
jgi:hypothetical protein